MTLTCMLDVERKGWKSFRHSILLGVLFYLCCACRAAGIVLLPSLFVWELLSSRRWPRPGVWVTLIVASAGIAVQAFLLRGPAYYADQVHFSISVMLRHFAEYAWSLRNEFLAIPNPAGSVVLCLFVLLGLLGYLAAVRRGITVLEVFAPAYIILIVLWTSDQDPRFLLPLIPLWVLYADAALLLIRNVAGRPIARGASAAVVVIIALGYAHYFARAPYDRDPSGTNNAEFLRVCQFVRDKTPRDSIFLFSKPRLLALLSNRKSAVYPLGGPGEITEYARQIGAEYVIVGDSFENDRRTLLPAVAAHPEVFEAIFQSGSFAVYQILANKQRATTPVFDR